MTLERALQQVLRMAMRSLVSVGLSRGIDYASRRGKDRAEMTAEEKTRAAETKKTVGRLRRAIRMLRRTMR
ncbi:MAG: hypothetical protein KDE03_04435 [Rhodobacteraceae bacterium]|nr:hypothetical protein [Paracoccaceae bacterium]